MYQPAAIILLLALFVLPLVAASAQESEVRLPIFPVATARLDEFRLPGPIPVVTAGRWHGEAPPEPHRLLWSLNCADRGNDPYAANEPEDAARIASLIDGKSRLRIARAGDPVLLLLVSPELNSGEYWGPSTLTRQGHRLKLVVEGWRDNGSRKKNIPSRHAYLLWLAPLESGEYTLDVESNEFLLDVEQARTRYAWTTRTLATTRLAVLGANDPNANGTDCPTVAAESFQGGPVKEIHPIREYQPPRGFARPVRGEGRARVGIQVGTVDLPGWLAAGGTGVPALGPLAAGAAMAHAIVIGPELNSMEWMTLREVSWDAGHARLILDVWRDQGGRDKNIPFQPVLAVPLTLVPAASPRTATVEWRFWTADRPGGEYAPDPAAAPGLLSGAESTAAIDD